MNDWKILSTKSEIQKKPVPMAFCCRFFEDGAKNAKFWRDPETNKFRRFGWQVYR